MVGMHSEEDIKANIRANDKGFSALETRIAEMFGLNGCEVRVMRAYPSDAFYNGVPTPEELVDKRGHGVMVDDLHLFFALNKLYNKQGEVVYCRE
jgi:hypothetical protein